MYDALRQDISEIKTGKFFQFDPPADAVAIENLERRFGKLPSAYKRFLQIFGGARLFREEEYSWHALRIFETPSIETTDAGAKLLKFGTYTPDTYADQKRVYLRQDEDGKSSRGRQLILSRLSIPCHSPARPEAE